MVSVENMFYYSSTCTCSSTNKTDHHDITEILLKATLDAINLTFSGSLIHIQNTEIYYEKQYQNDFIS